MKQSPVKIVVAAAAEAVVAIVVAAAAAEAVIAGNTLPLLLKFSRQAGLHLDASFFLYPSI